MASRRGWLHGALGSAALLMLAGCGFQLRQALGDVATVVEAPAQAQVVLESIEDTRERSVVATTAAGQVRELTLRVRFVFRLSTPAGRELMPPRELLLSRDLSYNETNALAKEQEEAQLYRAMQNDIVQQVLRRLSAARL